MDIQALTESIIALGAKKAEYITADKIVTDRRFFDICKANQCGNYGKCWTCPPDVGNIDELIAKVKSFKGGILYQYFGDIEDSLDIEGMAEVGKVQAALVQKVNNEVVPQITSRHFHLGAGGCRLCERCGKRDNIPCRHPDKALPSMESCGIDVYNTTKTTSLKYINGQNTVTYFGLVLFD